MTVVVSVDRSASDNAKCATRNSLPVERFRVAGNLFHAHPVSHTSLPHRRPRSELMLTVSVRAPLRFLPCASNAFLRSLSSFSHCSARLYSVGLGPRSTDVAPVIPFVNGHDVGSIRNVPRCICATCVGKLFRPSKIWVASVIEDAGLVAAGAEACTNSQRMVAPRASESCLRNVNRSSRTRTSRSTVTCDGFHQI